MVYIRIKYQAFAIVLFTALILSCAPDQQPKEELKTESSKQANDPSVKLKEQEYEPPRELGYTSAEVKLKDKLFPIGWSKSGLFAYATVLADEASNNFMMKVEILDASTGQIKWRWVSNDNSKKESVNSIWGKNYAIIKKKLNEMKIIQNEDLKVHKTSFTLNNNSYEIKLEVKTAKEPYMQLDVVVEGRLTIESNGEEKDISMVKEDNSMNILATQLAGCIKSPYEDKIAIIYKKERRGYEGPPHVSIFTLVGCDLKKTFK